MNKWSFYSVILSALVCVQALPAQEFMTKNYKLGWADEFNGKGLVDSERWSYEVGKIRNQEAQYYTKDRVENVRQEKGNLIIETIKESFLGSEYTSGSINTKGKYSFTGDFRVEVRAILPSGKGIWPAIWMMGTDIEKVGWPRCGELDIMEFVGHTPDTVHFTMHWFDVPSDKKLSKGTRIPMTTLHDQYHIYGLERVGDVIQVFVDKTIVMTFKKPEGSYGDSFVSPLYLLLNTAIGGAWGGEIGPSVCPQKFVIDYVRAYYPRK
ncbi:MAG: glycoside hydrolase family 16 protein [Bacteroidales bacterium]|nr:glycoside hydrolase family 16 protein [Bacteroidales bacterium]